MEKVKEYWQNRYVNGGTSGAGSYGLEATIKASIINAWIKKYGIDTITELGCGDSNNNQMYVFPVSYCGYDISPKAIEISNNKIKNDKYTFTNDPTEINLNADLCLSLDVYYHLTEENVFSDYCNLLFNGQWKYIIAYTMDTNSDMVNTFGKYVKQAPHLKQRSFTEEYKKHPQWELVEELSEYQTQDKLTLNFPNDKKFFLLKRID